MTNKKFRQLLESLPHLPGVYKYFDEAGIPIYVGKAKDLKKRVTSYFTKEPENYKTRKLVEKIHHIEFTIVDTERDAFLLENSLIKNFQPRYNINLKDDKSYPYIVIKNEPFPRVFLTRNIVRDGSEYFGPFTDVGKIRELLQLIRSLIPLRINQLELFLRISKKGKLKVSPEYYLSDAGRTEVEILTEEDYSRGLQQVRDILKGSLSSVITNVQDQMKECVRKMEFEEAEILRLKLEFMQGYRERSIVVNVKMGDLDVFTILVKDSLAFVNYLQVRKGNIVQTKNVTLDRKLEESQEMMLVFAIAHLRKRMDSSVKELVVPFPIDYPDTTLVITVPMRGDKKKLLDLSMKNVTYSSGENAKK